MRLWNNPSIFVAIVTNAAILVLSDLCGDGDCHCDPGWSGAVLVVMSQHVVP
jgi:hypothetical protein